MPEKQSFHIVHLEDQHKDRKQLKDMFPKIKRVLNDFFNTTFSYTDSDSKKNDFKPFFDFKLDQYSSVTEYSKSLIKTDGMPSEIGQSAILFILDYFLEECSDLSGQECGSNEITQQQVGNIPFLVWQKTYFPQIPILLLTKGGAASVNRYAGWQYLNKDIVNNIDEFTKNLAQLMSEWWEPQFSRTLEAYGRKTGAQSWHTPGHNAGNAFLRSQIQRSFYKSYGSLTFQTDLSVSVSHLGDLSEPDLQSPLKEAQIRSAAIFGAEETFFITNGTSTSNKAMLMTLLKPGEVVLLDRNCHKSVHQAVVMSGALPVYLTPAFNERLGVWTPLPMDSIRKFLAAEYEDQFRPRMLILTTSTYEGITYPIREIAGYCEENGILFYADEAWIPYFRFHPLYTRKEPNGDVSHYCAMGGGAHFAVQSTHKALAAFSQASMIHISPRMKEILASNAPEWAWLRNRFAFDPKDSYSKFRHELIEQLRYWHSTSPHYPMIATLDRAGIQMRLEGMRLLEERIQWVNEFSQQTENCIIGIEHIVGKENMSRYSGYYKDPLKLIIGFKDPESGLDFKNVLTQKHIQWEKASSGCVEFLITIGTSYHHLANLLAVIKDHSHLLGCPAPNQLQKDRFNHDIAGSNLDVLPRTAATCNGELVPLEESEGRICAQMLVPYPPGIPVFLPGLTINAYMIDLVQKVIQNGSVHDVHGICRKNSRHYLKVMQPPEQRQAESELKAFKEMMNRISEPPGD